MLICPICQCHLSKIDKQHLKKHHLTLEEYKASYGDDAPFGYSEELKAKKSGDNHPLKGKQRSEETKKKVSNGVKRLWDEGKITDKQRNGIGERSKRLAEEGNHFNKGKTHERSQDYRDNLSKALNEHYKQNPKPPLSEERMEFQIPHLEKIAEIKREKSKAKLEQDLELNWAEVLISSEHYSKGNFRFNVKCNCCNNISNVALVTLKKHNFSNTLCHTCFPPLKGESKAELEIAEFLQDYIQIVRHDKSILGNNLELDIVIPSKNLAVEYHGLYWHSSKTKYDKYKHRKKYELCKSKGIRLIQIFEDEWLNKKDLVKQKLLMAIGCYNSKKIFARKLKCQTISNKEANSFLEQYHIQGSAVAKINLGLFNEDELVAVMTFCLPRKALNQKIEQDTWELLRYATSDKYHIIGGASKLLSNFTKMSNAITIMSWADLRWTNPKDNVYLKLGFILASESKVGTFFTNFIERKHRWGFRKPKNIPDNLTTLQYWEQQGWYTIYDAGQIKFSLDTKKETT